MQLDRITNLNIKRLSSGWQRSLGTQTVVGAYSTSFPIAAEAARLSVSGQISEATLAAAQNKKRQLAELAENIGYPQHYFAWVTALNQWDGWYGIQDVSFDEDKDTLAQIPFTLNLVRLGTLGDHIPAQWWNATAETTTGFTTPTATTMISVPNSAADLDFVIAGTRTTSDGTIQYLENPTFATLMFTPSATLANWYLGECRVYDSVTAGDTTETNWVQVFGLRHVFAGDCVIQNGLLRYTINSNAGTFKCYDSGVAAAWKTVGQFKTALTGNLDATIRSFAVTSLTPDEIRWSERRHYGANRLYVEYTLRRGAMYCRAVITTKSLGIDTTSYVQLAKTDGFTQLFNAAANGAAGAGDLAQQASSNYEAGYNVTDKIVSGFALCNQPVKQPYDPGAGGHYLPASLTWGTGTVRTIFIMSFPAVTSSFVIATERAKAAAIAAHCLESVDQRAVIVPSNWKV